MQKKHILFALCGMSPAVISETIYELIRQNDVPDIVHIITTVRGWQQCAELMQAGVFDKLMAWGNKRFSVEKTILSDANCVDLEDIVTEDDSKRLGNTILQKLRSFTETDMTRISFSIAGGRKSMSAIGALCMTLLGRQEDKLYHILVSPPFDVKMDPPFYFPEPGVIHKLGNKKYRSEEAVLQLTPIAYPHIRDRYLLKGEEIPLTFDEAVAAFDAPLKLKLDFSIRLLQLGGQTVYSEHNNGMLIRQGFILMYIFCAAKKVSSEDRFDNETLCRLFPQYIRWLKKKLGNHFKNAFDSLAELDSKTITRIISDINKEMQNAAQRSGDQRTIYRIAAPTRGYYAISEEYPASSIRLIPEMTAKEYAELKELSRTTEE